MSHAIEPLHTPDAPAAVGPYSQGIVTGGLAFLSGQIPLDPKTGDMVSGGIEAQARQVLDNIRALVTAAGTDMSQVVKVTVFLTDMNDFAVVNSIYKTYFTTVLPARSVVQVGALPKGADIEMEAVVRVGS